MASRHTIRERDQISPGSIREAAWSMAYDLLLSVQDLWVAPQTWWRRDRWCDTRSNSSQLWDHKPWEQEYAWILFITSIDQVSGIQMRICGTPVMDRRYRWSGLAVLRPRNIQYHLARNESSISAALWSRSKKIISYSPAEWIKKF